MTGECDELPAGLLLDAMIHEEVFGLDAVGDAVVPGYSTSIAEAWKVVEAMPDDVAVSVLRRGPTEYACELWCLRSNNAICLVSADTAQLAICRAALVLF